MTVEITHDDLARAVAIARLACEARPWHFEDVYSACCLRLVHCADDFDGRGTWAGYSGKQMKWAAKDELRRLDTRAAVGGTRWNIAHAESWDVLVEQETADV